jgi:hypothetical protein
MAASRENPFESLLLVATTVAEYLRVVSRENFTEIMKKVREEYAEPMQSYIWFLFYNRERIPELDGIIDSLFNEDNQNTQTITTIVMKLFEEGGWEESSANTKLLRYLIINSLPNTNIDALLELNFIQRVHESLPTVIENRLKLENRFANLQEQNMEAEERLRLTQGMQEITEQKLREAESKVQTNAKILQMMDPAFSISALGLSELMRRSEDAKFAGQVAAKQVLASGLEKLRREDTIELQKQQSVALRVATVLTAPSQNTSSSNAQKKERKTRITEAGDLGVKRDKSSDTQVRAMLDAVNRRHVGFINQSQSNDALPKCDSASGNAANEERQNRLSEASELGETRNKSSDTHVKWMLDVVNRRHVGFFKECNGSITNVPSQPIVVQRRCFSTGDFRIKAFDHQSVSPEFSEHRLSLAAQFSKINGSSWIGMVDKPAPSSGALTFETDKPTVLAADDDCFNEGSLMDVGSGSSTPSRNMS